MKVGLPTMRPLMLFLSITAACYGLQVVTAEAKTVAVPDCSLSRVQAAVNSASPGDTVLVPAGDCTWSSALSITKAVSLQGAGAGSGGTRIRYGGSNHTLISVQGPGDRGKVTVSGFRFVGGDANFWNGTVMQLYGPSRWNNLRIHNNVFEDNYPWTIAAGTDTHALIDNNVFTGHAHGIKTYGDGASDWSRPLQLGTADFLFIEANRFEYDDNFGSTGSPAVDMFSGGRVVFRNNTLRNSYFDTHDKARSGLASANAYEVYGNSFRADSNKWKGLDITAGTGVIWGNTFEGDWTHPIGAMDYKTADPRQLRPCNGADPADQNSPGETGWRCQYQIGSMGEGASAYGYPLYLWNNRKGGAIVTMRCTAGCTHVRAGRDFIDNGTTVKPGYTPFRFPHPLAGSVAPAAPNPPTNLVVK